MRPPTQNTECDSQIVASRYSNTAHSVGRSTLRCSIAPVRSLCTPAPTATGGLFRRVRLPAPAARPDARPPPPGTLADDAAARYGDIRMSAVGPTRGFGRRASSCHRRRRLPVRSSRSGPQRRTVPAAPPGFAGLGAPQAVCSSRRVVRRKRAWVIPDVVEGQQGAGTDETQDHLATSTWIGIA